MITIKSDKPYGGELHIDMWYGDEFVPNKYGADAYDYNGRLSGNIYNEAGKAIGDYTATDSVLVGENFLIDFDINACGKLASCTEVNGSADATSLSTYVIHYDPEYDGYGEVDFVASSEKEAKQLFHDWCIQDEHLPAPLPIIDVVKEYNADDANEYGGDYASITSATKPDGDADTIHFWYNGIKLGDCPADDVKCPALLELMYNDEYAAKGVLDYLNSLGDPVYPVSEEDWRTPETDVSKVDKTDMYYFLMQDIGYTYDYEREQDSDLYIEFDLFEIFSDDEAIESSTKITSAIKNMHGKVNESDYRTGYLYLLKHGMGPGTLPKDATVLKSMDLPHGFTAVWLDSVLTTDELKEYDIPSETQLTRRLADIGYEINNQRELVPIENTASIQSSTGITASTGWENYGDADPIEYGRLVKSNGDGTYEMLYIEPYPEDENLYLAAWLYFDMWDVTDGWISDHIDRVLQSTSGVSADEFDVLDNPIETFVDCVSYFGPQEFSPEYIGQTSQFATREEVEEALASIGF